MRPESFDVTEDIIPSAAIQSDDMIFQSMKDFVGFESGQNMFDQNGRFDRSFRNFHQILREFENVIPQFGFFVTLHFRQIKIRTRFSIQQFSGVMEKIESEIEK